MRANVVRQRSDLEKKDGFKLDIGQILMIISAVILFITVALPMVMIVYNVFFYKGTFDWRLFTEILMHPDNLMAMWNTIKIAFLVTVFGTITGLFFAWLIARSDIPLKGLMKSLFTVPYMFPPFIGAMAWGLLLAPRSGYINKMFMTLTGGNQPLFNINSVAGIVFVELCYYFPLFSFKSPAHWREWTRRWRSRRELPAPVS